jgi:peptide-methionine (S)-S-oxide reductase
MGLFDRKSQMPDSGNALPGRAEPILVPSEHFVLGTPMTAGADGGFEVAVVGMGCFWGAERKFWQTEGVHSTAVGYTAGLTPNATYEEVCSGLTGHNEVVRIAFEPDRVDYAAILRVFWESHNPTQGMRQGNDAGTQYRSGVYCHSTEQTNVAKQSRDAYQKVLSDAGYGAITTEIIDAPVFYYAEEYHQQYLAKNPGGYCGLGGTGVSL